MNPNPKQERAVSNTIVPRSSAVPGGASQQSSKKNSPSVPQGEAEGGVNLTGPRKRDLEDAMPGGDGEASGAPHGGEEGEDPPTSAPAVVKGARV